MSIKKKYVTADQITSVVCDMDEQETTIQISRDGELANIWSSDNTMITKLKKCVAAGTYKCWEGSRNSNGELTGYFFQCNKKFVTFRTKEITLTDKQKEARLTALNKARSNKK